MAAEHTVLIGSRIAQAREAAGLTQKELADALPGKSDGTQVSKWERGIHRPGDDTLRRIAEVVSRDVAWFHASAPDKSITPDLFANAEESQLSRIEAKLDRLLILAGVEPQAAIAGVIGHAEAAAGGKRPAQSSAAKGRSRKAPPTAA